METWFIADTHFDHANVLLHNDRPWDTVEEMNEGLISNWNSMVDKRDRVFIVGDFAWKRHGFFINALRGRKVLIKGSHDKMRQEYYACFEEVVQAKRIKLHGSVVYMIHCCPRIWPCSHYGSIALFGHSHGRLVTHNLSFDVGVDANNYKPVPWSVVEGWAEQRTEELKAAGRIVTEGEKTLYRQDDVFYWRKQVKEENEISSVGGSAPLQE